MKINSGSKLYFYNEPNIVLTVKENMVRINRNFGVSLSYADFRLVYKLALDYVFDPDTFLVTVRNMLEEAVINGVYEFKYEPRRIDGIKLSESGIGEIKEFEDYNVCLYKYEELRYIIAYAKLSSYEYSAGHIKEDDLHLQMTDALKGAGIPSYLDKLRSKK